VGCGIELLEGSGLESLEVGIMIPSFLSRYTNFVRSAAMGPVSPASIAFG
jgi:hypothetical protein